MRMPRGHNDLPVTVYIAVAEGSNRAYVGITTTPIQVREAAHVTAAFRRQKNNACAQWMRECIEAGQRITLLPLESIPTDGDAEAAERFWIEYFAAIGVDLTNETRGGLGHLGHRLSAATREKIAASKRGVRRSPDVMSAAVAASIAANTGSKRSDATRAKMSASAKAARARRAPHGAHD